LKLSDADAVRIRALDTGRIDVADPREAANGTEAAVLEQLDRHQAGRRSRGRVGISREPERTARR
jgi:hypothetical protein